jgi:YcaO-like protein with predicted kinase domain
MISIIKDIPLDWIDGYSLSRQETISYPLNINNLMNSSNGLGAGNTKEEAITQAICEVIERHHTTYLLENIESDPPLVVNLQSIRNPIITTLLNALSKSGITIHLLYISKVLNVPTFICCGVDDKPNKAIEKFCFGYGCHTSPDKAMIRALTEYIQSHEGLTSNTSIPSNFDLNTRQWHFRLNISIEQLAEKGAVINTSDIEDISSPNFKEEIERLTSIISEKGYELIIIDKTHPMLRIPTYRVYAPGFESIAKTSVLNDNTFSLPIALYLHAGMRDQAIQYIETYRDDLVEEAQPLLELMIKMKLSSIGSDESMLPSLLKKAQMDLFASININNFKGRDYISDVRRLSDIMNSK